MMCEGEKTLNIQESTKPSTNFKKCGQEREKV
jgi:hypothetical protein